MGPKETEALLTAMLDERGVGWVREKGLIRFRLRRGGMSWEADCQCLDGRVVIYGRYPFEVKDRGAALRECNEANLLSERGTMLLPKDGRPAFRTFAELDDIFDAASRLRRALDDSVHGVTRFWGRLESACRVDL